MEEQTACGTDIKALRAAAEKVGSHPADADWCVVDREVQDMGGFTIAQRVSDADAAYIALACPANIVPLLDRLEAAESALAALQPAEGSATASQPTDDARARAVEREVERVVLRVCEYDDRSSPDDWPEALLITSDELTDELRQFAEALAAFAEPPATASRVGRETLLETIQTIIGDWRAGRLSGTLSNALADTILALPLPAEARVKELEEALAHHEGKRAPVQGFKAGIPWDMHLQAYDAYSKKWAPQPAMIDLEGRNCRGGFSTGELDDFIPGWREELQRRADLARAALSKVSA